MLGHSFISLIAKVIGQPVHNLTPCKDKSVTP